ncbi:MAG TPA: mechanosensitive ion channel family protein [Polyangiaceae bacterium]|nr:mechanosensitive ion channel family protein [Polyangiaceae bacterium]
MTNSASARFIDAGAPSNARDPVGLVSTSVQGLAADVIRRLPEISAGIAVFFLFLLLAHGARWAITRSTGKSRRANVGLVVGRLMYVAIVLLGTLVALTVIVPSMTPAKLISMLGIGGVAIGFAFKDLFQNLLAGILILWREPFRVGDEITAGAFTGTVEAIETRATFIRTYDGQRTIIPNSQIYTEAVSVITAYDMIRSQYDIGIGYGDDIQTAKKVVREILESTEQILRDPKPEVMVWDLAGSSINLRARWWSKPQRPVVVDLRDRVLEQVRVRLGKAGIDLPYPTQVVLFHDQSEVVDGDRARQR